MLRFGGALAKQYTDVSWSVCVGAVRRSFWPWAASEGESCSTAASGAADDGSRRGWYALAAWAAHRWAPSSRLRQPMLRGLALLDALSQQSSQSAVRLGCKASSLPPSFLSANSQDVPKSKGSTKSGAFRPRQKRAPVNVQLALAGLGASLEHLLDVVRVLVDGLSTAPS